MDFHICGVKQNKLIEKNDEIGQMLVSGALDDTKKMRKAGADIFAKSGLENPPKKIGKNPNFLRNFPRFSRGLSQTPVNSRTNGWEPSDRSAKLSRRLSMRKCESDVAPPEEVP